MASFPRISLESLSELTSLIHKNDIPPEHEHHPFFIFSWHLFLRVTQFFFMFLSTFTHISSISLSLSVFFSYLAVIPILFDSNVFLYPSFKHERRMRFISQRNPSSNSFPYQKWAASFFLACNIISLLYPLVVRKCDTQSIGILLKFSLVKSFFLLSSCFPLFNRKTLG